MRRPIFVSPIPWREAVGVYFHKRVRGVDAAIHSRPCNLVSGTSQLLPVLKSQNFLDFDRLPIAYFHGSLPG